MMYICVCTCMYVCVHVCMYVCVYVCIHGLKRFGVAEAEGVDGLKC